MNTPSVLLAELARRGVDVWAEGERLRYRAPRGALTPALLGALRAHKAELLEALRPGPQEACHACGHRDWWRRPGGPWTCAVCHPPAVEPVERVKRPAQRPPRPARLTEPEPLAAPEAPKGRVPRCQRCGAEVAHWSVTICQRCRDAERLRPAPLAKEAKAS